MKLCTRCSCEKSLDNFRKDKSRKDGFHPWCSDCYNEKRRARMADPEYHAKYCKHMSDAYAANPEPGRQHSREWRKANAAYNRARQADYTRKRLKSDPVYRLRRNLSSRVNQALRGRMKEVSVKESLGCNLVELRTWIERQFVSGMSWDNYGPVWHVDHRKPLCAFDLTQREEQLKANHFTNLQPLFAAENLSKNGKWLGDDLTYNDLS